MSACPWMTCGGLTSYNSCRPSASATEMDSIEPNATASQVQFLPYRHLSRFCQESNIYVLEIVKAKLMPFSLTYIAYRSLGRRIWKSCRPCKCNSFSSAMMLHSHSQIDCPSRHAVLGALCSSLFYVDCCLLQLIKHLNKAASQQGSKIKFVFMQWDTPLCAKVAFRMLKNPDYQCTKYVSIIIEQTNRLHPAISSTLPHMNIASWCFIVGSYEGRSILVHGLPNHKRSDDHYLLRVVNFTFSRTSGDLPWWW